MLLLLCVGTLSGQRITFSVDVQGPTAGLFGSDGSILDSFYNNEIDGADILTTGVPGQPIPPNPNLAALGPVNDPPGILAFGINQNVPNSRTLNLAPTSIGTRPEPEAEVVPKSQPSAHSESRYGTYHRMTKSRIFAHQVR